MGPQPVHARAPWGARLAALAVAAVAGAAAVVASGAWDEPQPALFARPFQLRRAGHEPLRVTESRVLSLDFLYADYDLLATVELPEASELDLVFRKVEPRVRETGGAGGAPAEELIEFHGRFTLLRLSTRGAGPPLRTRDEALFGAAEGGLRLRAGTPASIRLEARGRTVRVNVAGQWLPPVEATDAFGNMALIARGGTALVHDLAIQPVPRHAPPPGWLAGAAAAALAAAGAAVLSGRARRVALAFGLLLPLGGWAAHALLFAYLLPWARPELLSGLAGALALLPLATALALRRRRWWLAVPALLCAPVLLELAARVERPRLAPFEDPRLDLHFGISSGTAPFDALARRVRGTTMIHTLEGAETRVLFLGGEAIFAASPDLAAQVGLRTAIALQQRLGHEVEGIVAPAVFGHALQHLLWLRRFYVDLDPDAVVLGLTGLDGIRGRRARARLEAAPDAAASASGSVLWALHHPAPPDGAIATPADLERALVELDDLCRTHGWALVLATTADLAPSLRAAAEHFAQTHGRRLVHDVLDRTGSPRIDALVDALAGLL